MQPLTGKKAGVGSGHSETQRGRRIGRRCGRRRGGTGGRRRGGRRI